MEAYLKIKNNIFHRILKNIFAQMLTQAIDVGSIAILQVLAAREWGPDKFGKYAFIMAITSVLLFACDMGLNVLLIRNIAREKEKATSYLKASLRLSTVLSFVTFLGIYCFANVLKIDPYMEKGIYAGFIYVLLGVFISLFRGVFFAFEYMEYETLGKFIERIFSIILGVWGIYSGRGVVFFLEMLCVSRIFGILYCYLIYSKTLIRKHESRTNSIISLQLLREAWPFGVNILLTSIYLQNGLIFLTLLSGEKETGYFRAVLNILMPFSIAIESINMAFMPNLSRWYVDGREKIIHLVKKGTSYILLISIPVSVMLFIFSNQIIRFLYGKKYIEAGVIVQIIAFSIVIRILKNTYAVVLTSINRQRERTFSVGVGTFFSVILNYYLIKTYGYIGAAISCVLGEVIIFAGIFYFIRQYLKFEFYPNLSKIKLFSIK